MENIKDDFSKGSKSLFGKGELLGVKQNKKRNRITKANKKKMDLMK